MANRQTHSIGVRHWRRTQSRPQRMTSRPVLESLENRTLMTWGVDTGFGAAGHTSIPDFVGESHAIHFQTVGGEQRILVGGHTTSGLNGNPDFALARLTSSGELDLTFNKPTPQSQGTGFRTQSFYDSVKVETINAITVTTAQSSFCGDLQATSKILVAGRIHPLTFPPSMSVWGLMRFCGEGPKAGWLDETYGGHLVAWTINDPNDRDPLGMVSVNFPDRENEPISWMTRGEAFAITTQPATSPADIKTVVAGYAKVRDGEPGELVTERFAVARLNADGSYDTSFHIDGRRHLELAGEAQGHSLQLVQNGANWDIILGGRLVPLVPLHPTLPINTDFAVVKFDHQGNWITTFGSSGVAKVDFSTVTPLVARYDIAWDMAIGQFDLDQRIVLGGETCLSDCRTGTPDSDFAVAMLTMDGQPVLSFSADGKATQNFELRDMARGIDLQTPPSAGGQREIVLAGFSMSSSSDAAVFRGARFDRFGVSAANEEYASAYTGTPTGAGDVGWDVLVDQANDRILTTGFHTDAVGPHFGVLKVCADPDTGDCTGMAGPGGGEGGGGESGFSAPMGLISSPAANPYAVNEPAIESPTSAVSGDAAAPPPQSETTNADYSPASDAETQGSTPNESPEGDSINFEAALLIGVPLDLL